MTKWISVEDKLPEDGDMVIACYQGVYDHRLVHFWRDAGLFPHFGMINEPDGKGSQPATHWTPVPTLPWEAESKPVRCECEEFNNALEPCTDRQRYGRAITLWSGNYLIGNIDDVPPIKFCPFCGREVPEVRA